MEVEKRKRFDKLFPIVWTLLISLSIIGLVFFSYQKNHKSNFSIPNSNIAEVVTEDPQIAEEVPEQVAETIAEAPPKYSGSGKIQGKPIATSAGSAVAVSTGELTSEDISKLNAYSTLGAASSIAYVDTTGRYPALGDTLKDYINSNLLHTTDLAYMYEIRVVDCSDCNYSGLYTGSYMQSGQDITKAYGYITLNALPYKDNARFVDYMKLILSHEYGHHYTLYHRWVDLDVGSGERFPDAYYTVRPLTKATTTFDYSLGWENCDSEIIAEDYSYFYSGYGYHAMSGTYGLPSSPGTKNWLIYIGQSNTSATPNTSTTEPTTPPEAPASNPEEDTVAPDVQFLKPQESQAISDSFEVQVSASDNVKLTKIELFFDGTLILSTANPFTGVMDSTKVADGTHVLKAKAYDSSGNTKEVSVSITVDNTVVKSNPVKNK